MAHGLDASLANRYTARMAEQRDNNGNEREARLAEALRENLRRRKQQARQRKAPSGRGPDQDGSNVAANSTKGQREPWTRSE